MTDLVGKRDVSIETMSEYTAIDFNSSNRAKRKRGLPTTERERGRLRGGVSPFRFVNVARQPTPIKPVS